MSITCFKIQQLCILRTESICWFRMILGIERDYFLKEH
jgi:hypothetical protein